MKCTRSSVGGTWDNAGLQAARDGCFNDLLHTGVIVSTSSTSEWPVTSVLGLRREEIRIKCGFHRKKKKQKKKKKQVVRWKAVVFTGKMSYTVVVMSRP